MQRGVITPPAQMTATSPQFIRICSRSAFVKLTFPGTSGMQAALPGKSNINRRLPGWVTCTRAAGRGMVSAQGLYFAASCGNSLENLDSSESPVRHVDIDDRDDKEKCRPVPDMAK